MRSEISLRLVITRQFFRMLSTGSAGEFDEPGSLFGMYQSSAIVYYPWPTLPQENKYRNDLVRILRIFRSFERADLKKNS